MILGKDNFIRRYVLFLYLVEMYFYLVFMLNLYFGYYDKYVICV